MRAGDGISKYNYTWPSLAIAPRFGAAYDVTGQQRIVVRGGTGLFFDRPDGDSIYYQSQNPPTSTNQTVRNGRLQDLGAGSGVGQLRRADAHRLPLRQSQPAVVGAVECRRPDDAAVVVVARRLVRRGSTPTTC